MPDPAFPRPPAHIEPFVRILGPKKAVEFLLEFGGTAYTFSPNPRDSTRVVQMIGREAVQALSAEITQQHIPTGKPWIAQMLYTDGLPISDIVRKLHMSDKSVRRWLKRQALPSRRAVPKADSRQMNLL